MSKKYESEHPKKARLRIVLPTGETVKRKVTGAENHIGRGADSEIRISDPQISAIHATLAFNGDSYFIVDEGGEGGTFVNEEKVTGSRKLVHGDVIKMGQAQVIFRHRLSAETPEARLAKGAPSDVAVGAAAASNSNGQGSAELKKHHKKHRKDKRQEKTYEQADSAVGAEASLAQAARSDVAVAAAAVSNSNGQGPAEHERHHKKHRNHKHQEKPYKRADSAVGAEASLAQAAGSDVAVAAAAVSNSNGQASTEHKRRHKKHRNDKHQEKIHKSADSAVGAKAIAGEGGREEEKNKKKEKPPGKEKKEKEKDERIKAAKVRAWGGIIATVLSVVLTVAISLIVTRMGTTPTTPVVYGSMQAAKKLASPSEVRKISGGKYEASGAAAVPGANGVLFVDDSKPDQVFYMPLNDLGEQDGPVKAIPLGVSVENPEGITQLGTRYVIVGSLSTLESNNKGGVASFDFDPATQTVSRAVLLTGMRKFLFDNVPELKAWANKTSIEGGLNIEGIAVDPDPRHPRVLLGLRGPVLNGNALIVPLKQRDRVAPLSLENLEMDEPNAIQLNLNGQAIRDLEYDPSLRAFLIISGAPETEKKTDFALWTWNGEANQAREEARPKLQTLLDKKMKPEGVAHVKIADQEFVFLVGDSNSYAKVDYSPQ